MKLIMAPARTAFLLLASLSRDLLLQHNSQILKTLLSTGAWFCVYTREQNFLWILAARRNV